jgi:hypothetical protein
MPKEPIGAGGYPYATPRFLLKVERNLREAPPCFKDPGANIPAYWFDGGDGWVARYFTNASTHASARQYRCQVPLKNGSLCNFKVDDRTAADEQFICNCVAQIKASVLAMERHLRETHQITEPPLTAQWATPLFDSEGLVEAIFCYPCQASRQFMAQMGHENDINYFLMVLFGLLWVQYVHVSLATRCQMKLLGRIDEGCPKTTAIGVFCPCCSVAQTYRELSAAGVWPGSTLCGEKPKYYGVKAMTKIESQRMS